ncbi:TIR domain-containing protein [Pseudorhodoferax sp.]|uniref:TIR domain-containing protein n=1 Tax=Pseudorhodoferax sp. TaxID=1993553 RepID=UPI0039E52DAD
MNASALPPAQAAARAIEQALRERSDTLDLHGLGLVELPPLPAALHGLLRRLRLGGNLLQALPATLWQLDGLEELDLSGNRLAALDAGIGRLQALRVLDLSRNRLGALPPGLAACTRLVRLDLSGNRLTAVDTAALPAALRELLLDDNWLAQPPAPRPTLTRLSCRGNPFNGAGTAPYADDRFADRDMALHAPRAAEEAASWAGARPDQPAVKRPTRRGATAGAVPPEASAATLPAALPAAARDAAVPGAEAVDAAVFCPPEAGRGSQLLVQVFLVRPQDAAQAEQQARQADAAATHRGTYSLPLDLAPGTRVDLRLEMPTLAVAEPDAVLLWRGRTSAAQFEVTVPADAAAGPALGRVRIAVDGVPVGTLRFQLGVAEAGAGSRPADARELHARRYRQAFVSYASHDRAEVLRRVQAFRIAGLSVFQDVLDLDPGERWEQALYREIDRCDVFLLFWSQAAAHSEWVGREIDYALARQQRDAAHRPDIQPVPIEGPPLVPPPASLSALHFNDALLAQIRAAEPSPSAPPAR